MLGSILSNSFKPYFGGNRKFPVFWSIHYNSCLGPALQVITHFNWKFSILGFNFQIFVQKQFSASKMLRSVMFNCFSQILRDIGILIFSFLGKKSTRNCLPKNSGYPRTYFFYAYAASYTSIPKHMTVNTCS